MDKKLENRYIEYKLSGHRVVRREPKVILSAWPELGIRVPPSASPTSLPPLSKFCSVFSFMSSEKAFVEDGNLAVADSVSLAVTRGWRTSRAFTSRLTVATFTFRDSALVVNHNHFEKIQWSGLTLDLYTSNEAVSAGLGLGKVVKQLFHPQDSIIPKYCQNLSTLLTKGDNHSI